MCEIVIKVSTLCLSPPKKHDVHNMTNRHGTPRPRHALPRLPWPRQGQRHAKAKAKARQCCQGQGKASWHAEAKDKARHAKAKARLPGPRQCQPWAGKAGPVYMLLGLENTIDEICNYGHPNPTDVTPMSCFESRYASRRNCATLSEHARPVYRLLGLENTIDEICKYGHPNPT